VRRRRRGLANEVWEVDVGVRARSRVLGTGLINLTWLKEVWWFLRVAWVVGIVPFSGLWVYVTPRFSLFSKPFRAGAYPTRRVWDVDIYVDLEQVCNNC
jgi:hypothetical protein